MAPIPPMVLLIPSISSWVILTTLATVDPLTKLETENCGPAMMNSPLDWLRMTAPAS